MVPLKDGSIAAIEHLPVTTPTKTLGQMTCPTGGSNGAVAQMREKARGWVDKAKASKLNKRNSSSSWTSNSGRGYLSASVVSALPSQNWRNVL